jgi:hypothetical protein
VVPSATAAAAFSVLCAPERPVAHPGESVVVRAWVTDASGKALAPLVFNWNVSTGTLSGGDVAMWRFEPIAVGDGSLIEARAKVVVQHHALGREECELNLYLVDARVPSPDRSSTLTGRAFLLANNVEPPGYGLYSYLLFATPPKDDIERKRYLKALESYLLVLQPMEELERHRRRSTLNITLVPVKTIPELPTDLNDPKRVAQAAELVLAAYDYARAGVLFADLGQLAIRSGPYLISRLPATTGSESVRLILNMSHVSPVLVWDWMRAFCALSAHENSWNKTAVTKLALNTRNVIAVAADETPGILAALQTWVQVVNTR